jgi:antitoxin component YwqK of YwqJK toxin-antitoxin module
MALSPIPEYRAEEYSYVLRVESDDLSEQRVLYHEGVEIQSWTRIYDLSGQLEREEVRTDGTLERIHWFDSEGRIEQEILYRDGRKTESREMLYGPAGLTSVRVEPTDGEPYEILYDIDSTGRLREVSSRRDDTVLSRTFLGFARGRLFEEWDGRGEQGTMLRYNPNGLLSAREEWDGLDLLRMRRFRYSEDVVSRTETIDTGAGIRTVRTYDTEGRVLVETTYRNEAPVEEILYQYNETGLREKLRRRAGIRERWTYERTEDGTLSRAEYAVDGTIRKRTVYEDEETWYEELFRRGEAFLRVHYVDEVKAKEEFLRDGVVVRVRELENQ